MASSWFRFFLRQRTHLRASGLRKAPTRLFLEPLECRLTPTATPVSVNANGTAVGDFNSGDPVAIGNSAVTSANGRDVAFISTATNLLTTGPGGGPAAHVQTFWRDTQTGETRLLGVTAGSQPSISADGRFVAFTAGAGSPDSLDGGTENIYLYDSLTNTTQSVGQFTSGSGLALPYALSPDGRYVAFVGATTLGEGIGVSTSVRLWDSQAAHNNASPIRDWFFNTLSLTAGDLNSSFLGWTFGDGNFVPPKPTGDIHTGGTLNDNSNHALMFSGDSQTLFFSTGAPNSVEFLAPGVSDTNNAGDVYAYSLASGVTNEVSVTNDGTATGNQASSLYSASADGNIVLFKSGATNLDPTNPTNFERDDLYVRNRSAGTTTMISTNGVNSDGQTGDVSANGRYVVFDSGLPLTPKAPFGGIYRKDLQTGALELVDVKPDGTPADDGGKIPLVNPQTISADGRFIVWTSVSLELVDGLTNTFASGRPYVYVRDMTLGVTTLVSATPAGPTTGPANDSCFTPIISADGSTVYFLSAAPDLTNLTDLNSAQQVWEAAVPVVVDTTAPTSAVTFPSQPFYNGTTWTGMLTGTSSDNPGGTGVASVGVSISNGSLFWNGSAFASSSPVFNPATLTANGSWSYAFPTTNLTDGQSYIVQSEATDKLGNVETPAAGVSFTYDATAPTATITSGPGATLTSNSATFAFAGSDNVTPAGALIFLTSFDGSAFTAATSPVTLSGLALGSHTFQVEATDQAGNVGTAVTSTFTVISTHTPTPTPASGIGAFDSASGTWYLRNELSGGAPDAGKFGYGLPNWEGVVGDWNGDSTTTVGVVNPLGVFATWYLRNENTPGGADVTGGVPFAFGLTNWIPISGDWTGSGHTGIGMYDPVNFTWYLENNPGSGKVDIQFQYGFPGWIPVIGDWNHSGHSGIGLYDPSHVTWYLRNEVSAGAPDAGQFAYGFPGWLPLTGDWNGDGQATIGLFDPSHVTWYLRNENNAGAPDAGMFPYGFVTWVPVSGAWSGSATPAAALGQFPGTLDSSMLVNALLPHKNQNDSWAADQVFSTGL